MHAKNCQPFFFLVDTKLAISVDIYHCREPKNRYVYPAMAPLFDNTGLYLSAMVIRAS